MRLRRTPLTITASLTVTTLIAAGVADVTLADTARQRVVHAASCKLHPTGRVTAQLTDTFAGLRVLGGDLGTVHVTADGVQQAGTAMNIDAVLHNVTTHGSTDGGTATATIPYSALQQRFGPAAAGMTFGTDGTGLTMTGTLSGMGLPYTVQTSITTTANSLVLTPTDVTVLGQKIAASALGSMLGTGLQARTLALPALPASARLTGVRPDPDGLSLLLSIPHTSQLGASTPGTTTGAGCAKAKA